MEALGIFWNRNRDRIVFLGLILLCVLLLNLPDEIKISTASSVGRYAFLPLHRSISFITYLTDLGDRNRELLKKTTILGLETLELSQLKAENHRLRRLLLFKERADIDLRVARIYARSGGIVDASLFLNRGAHDNLRPGMAVVTPDGLIGRIKTVFPSSSVVILLSDPAMQVSVYAKDCRTLGIARWSSSKGYLVENIQRRSGIKAGELLLTTGYGGAFPRGIAVGRVSEVKSDRSGMFMHVEYSPSSTLGDLEDVLVVVEQLPATPLTSFSPSGQKFISGDTDSISLGWPEIVR